MSLYTKLIHQMHTKFGFFETVKSFTKEKFLDYLHFRADVQLREEVNELVDAIAAYREADAAGDEDAKNAAIHEINDAIVDILVFGFGTASHTMTEEELEHSYWTVMQANIGKEVGIKPGRPNPLGLPDLLKPAGWTAPDITPYARTLKLELNSRDNVAEEVQPEAPAPEIEPVNQPIVQETTVPVQQTEDNQQSADQTETETPQVSQEQSSDDTNKTSDENKTDTPETTEENKEAA